ncbi:MAG: hypothetical protein WAK57_09335 [Desulfobacterales bacterium]
MSNDTHRKTIGYVLWLFGFTGSHIYDYWTLNDQITDLNTRH